MNITPTVGRIVYFNPNHSELPHDFSPPADGQPLAAIIAAVLGGGSLLVLSVIDSGGHHHAIGPVPLVQEGEDQHCYGERFAYWMPYQLAQAGIKPMAPAPVPAPAAPAAPASAGQAPKVEEARINALVASLTYETAHVPGTTSTVATARLPGGFVVAIGHDATVSPDNFDAALGRQYAIEDAEAQSRKKLWEFEGYALYLRLEQLRAAGVDGMPAHQQRVVLEQIELNDRIVKLRDFIDTAGNEGSMFSKLPEDEQRRLVKQLGIQRELAAVLAERINAFPVVSA